LTGLLTSSKTLDLINIRQEKQDKQGKEGSPDKPAMQRVSSQIKLELRQ